MPLSGLTVLTADDNEAHNYVLTRTLQSLHAEVLRAFSGEQVLQLTAQKPDAILLDINLPDISGFEVCRKLKSNPETAEIPVIFITATMRNEVAIRQAESVGAATILFYPVGRDQLTAVIRGGIERRC